jgi:hypothetical protein
MGKRRRWQIHLSTSLVAMLISGALLGWNVTRQIDVTSDVSTLGHSDVAMSIKSCRYKHACGWPWRWWDDTGAIVDNNINFRADIGVCVLLVLIIGIFYEFRSRRLERIQAAAPGSTSKAHVWQLITEIVVFAFAGWFLNQNAQLVERGSTIQKGWPLPFDGFYRTGAVYNKQSVDVVLDVQQNANTRFIVDVAIGVAMCVVILALCRLLARRSQSTKP